MKSLMTLVIPCYNEEKALPLFMEAVAPIRTALLQGHHSSPASCLSQTDKASSNDECDPDEDISFAPCGTELIFVDDGSTDGSLSLLRGYNSSDPSVRYISFSRNFGKEAAIYAGLSAAKGDFVVLLDADLQHPVE